VAKPSLPPQQKQGSQGFDPQTGRATRLFPFIYFFLFARDRCGAEDITYPGNIANTTVMPVLPYVRVSHRYAPKGNIC